MHAEQAHPLSAIAVRASALAVTAAVLLINGSSFATLSDAQMATIKG